MKDANDEERFERRFREMEERLKKEVDESLKFAKVPHPQPIQPKRKKKSPTKNEFAESSSYNPFESPAASSLYRKIFQ